MQIIIENNDIKNMDSKVLASMLILIANGSAAPAENDLLAKEVAATEAEADVATVPAEEVAEVKAEDIIKVEEPAPAEEAKKPVKKATKTKKVKAEEPAPKAEEVKAAEPAPAEEADDDEPDDDEPDFDELDNIEDSEPAPKRTKAEMKKAITAFCNADPKNVKKLKEIASGMGYEKVKDMSEDDMSKMLEKAGI